MRGNFETDFLARLEGARLTFPGAAAPVLSGMKRQPPPPQQEDGCFFVRGDEQVYGWFLVLSMVALLPLWQGTQSMVPFQLVLAHLSLVGPWQPS